MAQMTMIQAITDALRCELKNDENVLVFGEDVGVNGGVFRATEGLQKEFGVERVFDTPLAESGIGGLAIGLALTGYRPVPEIQFFKIEIIHKFNSRILAFRFTRTGSADRHRCRLICGCCLLRNPYPRDRLLRTICRGFQAPLLFLFHAGCCR